MGGKCCTGVLRTGQLHTFEVGGDYGYEVSRTLRGLVIARKKLHISV